MALPPPLHLAGRLLARLERAGLGAAAADVAVERATDVVARRVRVLFETRGAGDDEPRRAEAAHEPVALDELLLDRVEPAVLPQPLDRLDLPPLRLDRERRAGVDGAAVDQQRAGAAGAAVAHALGAGEVDGIGAAELQVVAERV